MKFQYKDGQWHARFIVKEVNKIYVTRFKLSMCYTKAFWYSGTLNIGIRNLMVITLSGALSIKYNSLLWILSPTWSHSVRTFIIIILHLIIDQNNL